MKVTALLRNEHNTVEALFAKFENVEAGNQNSKRRLFDEMRWKLLNYFETKTEIFYPALALTASPTARNLTSAAEEQIGAIEDLLDSMNTQDENFDTRMNELIGAVTRHIETEEERIFDEARNNLTEYRIEELGLEMEQREKILTRRAA
jgi:hemerythrin HHE cation binding domain-containing protein